jgi:hypothetical protein
MFDVHRLAFTVQRREGSSLPVRKGAPLCLFKDGKHAPALTDVLTAPVNGER